MYILFFLNQSAFLSWVMGAEFYDVVDKAVDRV